MITLQILVIESADNNGHEVKLVPKYDTLTEEQKYRDRVDKAKPVIISDIRRIFNEGR